MSSTSQLGVAPSINIINTLAHKIGPIDEIKEAEAKGEASVRKSAKKRETLHNNNHHSNLASNNIASEGDGEWNYVPSIRKVSLRESPSRRTNRHL